MTDQNTSNAQGMAQSYLGFLDTNVLFKKPVSCLFAFISLLIPVLFIVQVIRTEVFSSGNVELIVAAIFLFALLLFAGVFGFLIWLHRRIIRDEGPLYYLNFRRFIQTMGEWLGTLTAIIGLGSVLILMFLLKDNYSLFTMLFRLPFFRMDFVTSIYGPVAGFVIIIATKLALFILDPIIWLIKQIWRLFARIVLYFYRYILNVHGVIEKHSTIWSGIVWLIAATVVMTGLFLCVCTRGNAFPNGIIILALGIGFMVFLVIKRKR